MSRYTLHALVHTTTHLICLDTHYMPWYTPLHTLHAMVPITTHLYMHITYLGTLPTYLGTHHYTSKTGVMCLIVSDRVTPFSSVLQALPTLSLATKKSIINHKKLSAPW